MSIDTAWFDSFLESAEFATLQKRPIAYFCAEYAFFEHEQTYAGGLGVLAGDYLREASDRQIPLVAVGLYYREGYLHHEAFSGNVVLKHNINKTPEEVGLTPVTSPSGDRIKVKVPIEDKQIYVEAWKKEMGSVTLYLLDTNATENEISDRNITSRLYTSEKEQRLKQEMILGIGGMRLLETLQISPIVYHLNEGHSAFLSFEMAHHEMKQHGRSFMEELEQAKQRIVFTNHTLIAAGNDIFTKGVVSALLQQYAQEIQVPVEELVSLGVIAESSIFSLTTLALRMASKTNAVSKLHAQKALEIWPTNTLIPITNGIHIPTWDTLGDAGDILEGHKKQKEQLLEYIAEVTGIHWKSDVFLLGWARRMVSYKRPLALLEDMQRLIRLLGNDDRPVHIVFAGQAHESDTEGAETLMMLQQHIEGDLKGKVVYLPDYTVSLAKRMVSGTDVWLNTPVVGFEACGTSGMKAALNGSLPCTTSDGWVYEVNLDEIGWILESDYVSQSVFDKLEQKILPLYYGDKTAWALSMQKARDLVLREFSATTMLRKYIEGLYKQSIDTQHTT